MNFEYDLLKLDIENNIATLTFNDPDSLNAMSAPMLSSMDLALDEIENPDNGVRALIVTGAGRGFLCRCQCCAHGWRWRRKTQSAKRCR